MKDQLHYHLSASLNEFKNLAPSNLLLWEVAKWGCKNGYKTFHLGGGLGCQEDGLYKFKKSFNKSGDIKFAVGKKIFDTNIYWKLVSISGKKTALQLEGFFPKYREER